MRISKPTAGLVRPAVSAQGLWGLCEPLRKEQKILRVGAFCRILEPHLALDRLLLSPQGSNLSILPFTTLWDPNLSTLLPLGWLVSTQLSATQ